MLHVSHAHDLRTGAFFGEVEIGVSRSLDTVHAYTTSKFRISNLMSLEEIDQSDQKPLKPSKTPE